MKQSDRYNKHSIEWKDEMVRVVDEWRASGQTIIAACKSASQQLNKEVHPSLYQWWKSKKEIEAGNIPPDQEIVEQVRHASPPTPQPANTGGKIKVTVKEYTFEGDHEQVMAAVTQFKNDGAN